MQKEEVTKQVAMKQQKSLSHHSCQGRPQSILLIGQDLFVLGRSTQHRKYLPRVKFAPV